MDTGLQRAPIMSIVPPQDMKAQISEFLKEADLVQLIV